AAGTRTSSTCTMCSASRTTPLTASPEAAAYRATEERLRAAGRGSNHGCAQTATEADRQERLAEQTMYAAPGRVNRPGFLGGSEPWKGRSHASTTEVQRGAV